MLHENSTQSGLRDNGGACKMLIVNGKEAAYPAECTVLELLEHLGYSPARTAVEKNGEIVPRAKLGRIRVTDGDSLEIVSFVGGG